MDWGLIAVLLAIFNMVVSVATLVMNVHTIRLFGLRSPWTVWVTSASAMIVLYSAANILDGG